MSEVNRANQPRTKSIDMLLSIAVGLFIFLPFLATLISFKFYFGLRILGITDLLVCIIFCVCGFKAGYSIRDAKTWLLETKFLWSVIISAAILGSVFIDHSFIHLTVTIIFLFTAPMIFVLSQKNSGQYAQTLLSVFIYCLSIYCVLFIILHTTELYVAPYLPSTQGTFPGFNNIRHIAPFFGAAAMIATFSFLHQNKCNQQSLSIFQFASLTLFWAILLFSGTRGGLLCVLAALFISLLINNSYWQRAIPMIVAPILAGSAIAIWLPFTGSHLGFLNMFFRLQGNESVDGFSSGRLTIWKAGIQSINDSPIWGHGIGNFKVAAKYMDDRLLGSHNVFIEYAHALGYVAGIALVLWLLIKWSKAAIAIRTSTDPIAISAFAGITFLLLYSNLNGVTNRYHSLLLFIMVFAILLGRLRAGRDISG